jgi:hypothetical protein
MPESKSRNSLLRSVDWRFLVDEESTPRVLDLASGELSEALGLVFEPAADASPVDLVVLEAAAVADLARARSALRPGGHVVCRWASPRPVSMRSARRRLLKAGFEEPAFYWPGPTPGRDPEFWLPLGVDAAIDHLFSQRPPASRAQALQRRLWRAAANAGYAAPLCAIARLSGGEDRREAGDPLSGETPWALLTHGSEIANAVVGLPFPTGGAEPKLVAKAGRIEESDLALEREAEVLRRVAEERPDLAGVPRVHASGRRVGRSVMVQDALSGAPLPGLLEPPNLAAISRQMTSWLADLAGRAAPQPVGDWARRLLGEPLEELERGLGSSLPADFASRARRAFDDIGEMPLVWEHRDLGPWNIVIDAEGKPAIFDWEYAEPQGLPAIDLTYLLTNLALAVETWDGEPWSVEGIRDCYGRLLDPSSERGAVFAECMTEYCERTGIRPEDLALLRLACWILQALIAVRQKGAGGQLPYFVSLAEDELRRIEGSTR